MAQPARRREATRPEEPPLDPTAFDRAYRYHRARRRALVRRRRERTYARVRFLVTFLVLVGLALFLIVVIWREIQDVFGL